MAEMDSLAVEDGTNDQFPVGMRVLAVDDDPICLKLLETLLRNCKYKVTTANQAPAALKLLRENRNKFDLVISDVNMPGMDGFKLLELVGLEMDLPVIMLSAHGDFELVMKGITHGACDYLLKPVRAEELQNIWQHVVRRKKFGSRDANDKASNQEQVCAGASEGCSSEQTSKAKKKRKDHQSEGEEEEGDSEESEQDYEGSSTQKKPRVVWSVDLHKKFVEAVNQLGVDKAVPKKILDTMNVEGLTRENVASHLQKYRLYLKRISDEANQNNMAAAFGTKDLSYLHMGQLDGFGEFRTLTGSRQLPSLSSFPQGGMLGRLTNSSTGSLPSLQGISSPRFLQPGHYQTLSNSTSPFGKFQSNLFQGNSASLELNQLLGTKCGTKIGDFSGIGDRTAFRVSNSFPDSGIAPGSSSNSIPCVSSNPLILQATHQQTTNGVSPGHQSSLSIASMNKSSFDIGVDGSFGSLNRSRSNESWQGADQLSRYPASSLPLNEPFSHSQLPANNFRDNLRNGLVEFSSSMPVSASLENSGGKVLCQTDLLGDFVQNLNNTKEQRWDKSGQGYNPTLNNSFDNMDSLDQQRNVDVSSISPLTGGMPYSGQHVEGGDKAALEPKIRSSEDGLLEQTKSHNDFMHNNDDTLDDIMCEMLKQDDDSGFMSMAGGFGFDAFPPGSCL